MSLSDEEALGAAESAVQTADADARQSGVASGDSPDAPSLRSILESVLLVVDEPVAALTIAKALSIPVERVEEELYALSAEFTEGGRGLDLRAVAGGWRLYTRPECAPFVERFVINGQQARLTQAALETLAVIAYRQPVARGRIAAIRGVSVDGVIRTLLSRGLIEEAGADPGSGAVLYRTTASFLERMGMNSLAELPTLADHLPDIETEEDILDSSSRRG